ncbi:YcnI family protein [Streptomyces violascens]|uniref:YcnI family protein n=1 Tax=Streptomyces violascens TaxID=67381 RepID=UPI00379165E1
MPSISTTRRRVATVAALTVAGVVAATGIASAHITVHPGSYAKGATDGVLTFRVPNEEDNAGTTQVQVFLPTDHPVLGVLVAPQDGWTAKVTNAKLKTPIKTDDGTITDAVSEITWTGGKVEPGHYEDFNVAFGQLPDDTDQLTFKTLQTYSDGKVVRWIEDTPKNGQAPENPAPVLQLTAKAADGSVPSGSPAAASTATKNSAAAASDSTARSLGIAGLVAGALGLIAAAFALTRIRSARSGTPQ